MCSVQDRRSSFWEGEKIHLTEPLTIRPFPNCGLDENKQVEDFQNVIGSRKEG